METLLRVPAALIAIAQKRLRNLKLSTDRLEISIVGHLFGTIKGNWAVVLRLDFMHTSIVLVVAFLKLLAYLLDLLDRTLVIVCQLIRQFSSILDPLELAIGLGKLANLPYSMLPCFLCFARWAATSQNIKYLL